MRGRIVRSVLGATVACAIAAGAAGAASAATTVKSDFDAGSTDGWLVQGDTSVPATHVPSGGNPNGFIRVVDSASGGVMFWNAPAKFLGNQANKYGGRLTFDLRQSATDMHFDDKDVILNGAGLSLVRDINPPQTTFTHYVLPLTPAGWVKSGTAIAPTVAELKAVLGAVTTLQIRAEYRNGLDTDDLDNVVLTRCRIVGTALSDVLTGTTNNDAICGLGGNDRITGDDGNDLIYGDEGGDRLYGQAGDDQLFGGTGGDLLSGSSGVDLLNGQGGADTCLGAPNDSAIVGCEAS